MSKSRKHQEALGSNDIGSTELGGNELSEGGLNSQEEERSKVSKKRAKKPSRR